MLFPQFHFFLYFLETIFTSLLLQIYGSVLFVKVGKQYNRAITSYETSYF
jgi:hypothetical protein